MIIEFKIVEAKQKLISDDTLSAERDAATFAEEKSITGFAGR